LKQANAEIRRSAAAAGIRLWQLADGLGITDASFSRKLRRELSADEKAKCFQIIENLSQQEESNG
jgi:hypothetical protein